MKKVGTLTEPVKERFRFIPSRFIYNDTDEDIDNYEVDKYALGDRFTKTKSTKEYFDSIHVITKSVCPIKNTKHLIAIGHRKHEKTDIIIVLTEIKK